MTSWKRLFGKKTKKAHRKLETSYEEWLRRLQQQYGVEATDKYSRAMVMKKKRREL